MYRRALLAGVVPAFVVGCSSQPGGASPVDLATVKDWANLVVSGLSAFQSTAISLAGNRAPDVQKAFDAMTAANNAMQQLTVGPGLQGAVQAIIDTINRLLPLVSVLVPQLAAILPEVQIALSVLSAFVGGISILVPQKPAKLVRAAATRNAR